VRRTETVKVRELVGVEEEKREQVTWNRLPDSVKLTEKPESFKKELKKTKA
jgi:hypothetical protein